MEGSGIHSKLKVLTVILDRKKIDLATKNYRRRHLPITLRIIARGTASSEMREILGVGSTDMVIFLSIIPNAMAEAALEMLTERLKLNKAGHGIAFTVPLSGIPSSIPRVFSEHLEQHIAMEDEDESVMDKPASSITHDLILTVVNEGFVSEVMSAARAAGATGGTAVSASRVGHEHAEAFFGMEFQTEKDVIVILCKREDKVPIMQAINKTCGLTTKAHGVVLALPVDQVLGHDPSGAAQNGETQE